MPACSVSRCCSRAAVGVSYGSSFGTPMAVQGFAELQTQGSSRALTATSYIQMMSHTAPVNIGLFFGLTGRVITTSSACTSGSQGIGYAFEAIREGKADVMVAGGAEELDVTMAAVFDTLFATSTRNDRPETTPRPFDRDRDGLVIGEGAGTLILEEREHALARGARIHAEIVGFATNSDGSHVTQPRMETMATRHEHGAGGREPRGRCHRLRQRARHRHRMGRHRRNAGHPVGVRRRQADPFA